MIYQSFIPATFCHIRHLPSLYPEVAATGDQMKCNVISLGLNNIGLIKDNKTAQLSKVNNKGQVIFRYLKWKSSKECFKEIPALLDLFPFLLESECNNIWSVAYKTHS